MAEIYLARMETRSGVWQEVVLKRLMPDLQEDSEFIQMFYDEARIASKLSHPNIAQIFELGELDGSLFIAMELIRGVNLKEIRDRAEELNKPIPLPIVLRIATGALEALAYAHTYRDEDDAPLNLVHRDVSPQNILVTYQGDVKLVDFGVAKAEGRLHQTRQGLVKGKFAYMAPEQITGEPIDGRADLFALAEVVYLLALRRHPFYAETDAAVLQAVMESRAVPPSVLDPKFPAPLAQLLLRALLRRPEARFPDARAMKEAIEAFLEERGHPPTQETVGRYVRELFADRIQLEEEARSRHQDDLLVEAMRTGHKSRLVQRAPIKLPPIPARRETRRRSTLPPGGKATPASPSGGHKVGASSPAAARASAGAAARPPRIPSPLPGPNPPPRAPSPASKVPLERDPSPIPLTRPLPRSPSPIPLTKPLPGPPAPAPAAKQLPRAPSPAPLLKAAPRSPSPATTARPVPRAPSPASTLRPPPRTATPATTTRPPAAPPPAATAKGRASTPATTARPPGAPRARAQSSRSKRGRGRGVDEVPPTVIGPPASLDASPIERAPSHPFVDPNVEEYTYRERDAITASLPAIGAPTPSPEARAPTPAPTLGPPSHDDLTAEATVIAREAPLPRARTRPEAAPEGPAPKSAQRPRGDRGAHTPAIAGSKIGRYLAIERIGSGALAEVLLARQTGMFGFERRVRIVRLLPEPSRERELVEHFLSEARAAARLTHPAIVQVLDIGLDGAECFAVLEHVEGRSLAELLERCRGRGLPVPAPIIGRVIAAIGAALEAAHAAVDADGRPAPTLHLDLSPDCVFIEASGAIRVGGFGLATSRASAGLTGMNEFRGRAEFAAPERFSPELGPTDARADVFAAGALLYELATLRSMWKRPTTFETMMAVLRDPVPAISAVRPELPASIDVLLQRAVHKNPAERLPSAGALILEAERCLVRAVEPITDGQVARFVGSLFAMHKDTEDALTVAGVELHADERTAAGLPASLLDR